MGVVAVVVAVTAVMGAVTVRTKRPMPSAVLRRNLSHVTST